MTNLISHISQNYQSTGIDAFFIWGSMGNMGNEREMKKQRFLTRKLLLLLLIPNSHAFTLAHTRTHPRREFLACMCVRTHARGKRNRKHVATATNDNR